VEFFCGEGVLKEGKKKGGLLQGKIVVWGNQKSIGGKTTRSPVPSTLYGGKENKKTRRMTRDHLAERGERGFRGN